MLSALSATCSPSEEAMQAAPPVNKRQKSQVQMHTHTKVSRMSNQRFSRAHKRFSDPTDQRLSIMDDRGRPNSQQEAKLQQITKQQSLKFNQTSLEHKLPFKTLPIQNYSLLFIIYPVTKVLWQNQSQQKNNSANILPNSWQH